MNYESVILSVRSQERPPHALYDRKNFIQPFPISLSQLQMSNCQKHEAVHLLAVIAVLAAIMVDVAISEVHHIFY